MTVHDPDLRPADMPTGAADPTEAGGILTIDLAALAANWKTLASTTVPVECAAVVKGDGYGCGLEPVTRTLSRARGCARCPHLRSQWTDAGLGAGIRSRLFAAGHQQHHRTCRMGCVRRHPKLAWRRSPPRRYRNEPARHHGRRGGRHRSAPAIRKPRLYAVDEPPRLR